MNSRVFHQFLSIECGRPQESSGELESTDESGSSKERRRRVHDGHHGSGPKKHAVCELQSKWYHLVSLGLMIKKNRRWYHPTPGPLELDNILLTQ